MRYRSAILLLGLLAGPAVAQEGRWIRIDSTARVVTFLDSANIQSGGNGIIEVRRKWQYAGVQEIGQDIYDTRVDHLRITCPGASSMVLETARYHGTTLVLRSRNPVATRHWSRHPPGSTAYALVMAACRMAGVGPPG